MATPLRPDWRRAQTRRASGSRRPAAGRPREEAMMSDLHWTGAALLLAVATLGGSASRGRQTTEVSWDVFAREHGIGADGPSVDPTPSGANTVVPAAER